MSSLFEDLKEGLEVKVRIKCDDSCIHCEKEVIDNDRRRKKNGGI